MACSIRQLNFEVKQSTKYTKRRFWFVRFRVTSWIVLIGAGTKHETKLRRYSGLVLMQFHLVDAII